MTEMSLCCISCKILCFLFLCVYVCGHTVTQFLSPPFYFICLCGFTFWWLFWTQWHTKTEIVFCWFVQIWAHGTSGQFKEWLVQLRGSGWSKPDLNKGTAAPMENLQEWFETSVEVVEGRWLFAAPNWTLSLCSGSAAELCRWLPGQYKNVFYNAVRKFFCFFLYKVWPWSLSNPPIKMWGDLLRSWRFHSSQTHRHWIRACVLPGERSLLFFTRLCTRNSSYGCGSTSAKDMSEWQSIPLCDSMQKLLLFA